MDKFDYEGNREVEEFMEVIAIVCLIAVIALLLFVMFLVTRLKGLMKVEENYGCRVHSLGYDRYNAISTAQKCEKAGITTVEIRQHSTILHAPTKWLSELIEDGKIRYNPNKLLEINFNNARCTYDTNLNRYVNKKKSNGKVDEVVSIIHALYLLQRNNLM